MNTKWKFGPGQGISSMKWAEFLLNEMFHTTCDVSVNTNQLKEPRVLQVYFLNVFFEWNLLDQIIKDSNTLADFKRKLLAVIRPVKKSVYNVYNMTGIRNVSKLHLKFSLTQ